MSSAAPRKHKTFGKGERSVSVKVLKKMRNVLMSLIAFVLLFVFLFGSVACAPKGSGDGDDGAAVPSDLSGAFENKKHHVEIVCTGEANIESIVVYP